MNLYYGTAVAMFFVLSRLAQRWHKRPKLRRTEKWAATQAVWSCQATAALAFSGAIGWNWAHPLHSASSVASFRLASGWLTIGVVIAAGAVFALVLLGSALQSVAIKALQDLEDY
jgi:hypothetical protein